MLSIKSKSLFGAILSRSDVFKSSASKSIELMLIFLFLRPFKARLIRLVVYIVFLVILQ